jgi:ribA/ribD-fused uncharacterized protein
MSDTEEYKQLTALVNELKDDITEMRKTQTKMLEMMQKMTDSVQTEKDLRLKAEENLKRVQETLKPDQTLNEQSATAKPSLLLGTSLLRNVDAKCLDNWEVIAKGGATVDDLLKALNDLPDVKTYAEIVVVGGSIDVESKSVDDIVTDFQALTVSSEQRTEKTTICSILPRTDKDLAQKTKTVNDALKKACDDGNGTFLEIDDSFHLQNGSVNTASLTEDGLHLSKHGVDVLLKNCNVKMKDGAESAFTTTRYKKDTPLYFNGHTHPLSNFYPVDGLTVHGVPFSTSEAAYVYEKALHHNDMDTAEAVRKSKTGIHAKRLGDRIRTNARWQQRKIDVMDTIIRAKLKVCQAARKVLVDSGDRELIENTTHEFWGKGKMQKGENMLGKLWMIYRKKVRDNTITTRKAPTQHWATRNEQPKCYRCGESGHLSEQCRQPNTLVCWSCGNLGHKLKHCRYRARHSTY